VCRRAEIALTDGRLMGVARELNATTEEERALRRRLSALERELRDANATVASKQSLLDDYLTSGFTGRNTPDSWNAKLRNPERPEWELHEGDV